MLSQQRFYPRLGNKALAKRIISLLCRFHGVSACAQLKKRKPNIKIHFQASSRNNCRYISSILTSVAT
jgi:hypothetical protein